MGVGNGTGTQAPTPIGLYSEFLDGTVLQVSFCQREVSSCLGTLSFLVTCLVYCRCPFVSLVTCHLGLSGPSHPITHNPDTLNFLELLLGCCPGHGVIQIPVLDEIRHPGFPAVWFTLDGIQSCIQIRSRSLGM